MRERKIVMKEYTRPEIEITKFHTEDIITVSEVDGGEIRHNFNTLTGEPSKASFPNVWPNA